MDDAPRPRVESHCPRCSAKIRVHPRTFRIPRHPLRGEKGADRCSFSGDYLPGFAPENPIRPLALVAM